MDSLIEQFVRRYLPRQEIIHRLPVSVPISDFWPVLLEKRRSLRRELPLLDQNSRPFWFVINESIEKQCDAIAAMARRDIAFTGLEFEELFREAVIDEAVYSSVIEGAFTSRKEAADFIKNDKKPRNKSEQMVKNNYDALTYVLEHLEEDISKQTILEIARIVTSGAADDEVRGYRSTQVYVHGPHGLVYAPPEVSAVPEMMSSLTEFIQNSELHPVLKACIAHFYLVYIHPFADGNGRTARALSYMMLLRSGYDFFRYFSISGIVAEERGKYYRSMKNVEDSDSDMTYFIDVYGAMLETAVERIEYQLTHHVLAERRMGDLRKAGRLNERQLNGAKWLLEGEDASITVDVWRRKYKIVTETARRDLLTLCEAGLLLRKTEGRKAVFYVLRWGPCKKPE